MHDAILKESAAHIQKAIGSGLTIIDADMPIKDVVDKLLHKLTPVEVRLL